MRIGYESASDKEEYKFGKISIKNQLFIQQFSNVF